MKAWKFFFVLFGFSYGVFYWLLTRPVELTSETLSTNVSPTAVVSEVQKGRSPASKQEVILGMAKYVDETQGRGNGRKPSVIETKSTEVFGFALNFELQKKLDSEIGMKDFQNKIGNGAHLAVMEVEETFKRHAYQNKKEQLALLDLTNALLKVSPDEVAKERLVTETKDYLQPSEQQDLDYAGRSLQYFLDHEKDESKRIEVLNALGVEMAPPIVTEK